MFRYAAIGSEFFDPAKIGESAGHQLMLNVFEGLYSYALGDGPPVPALATGCTVTDDGLLWTCTIRAGITWSDGVPITAHDFEWSYKRVLDPATASRSAQLLWPLAGAREFNDGTVKNPDSVGVKALDDHTLQLRLHAPTPWFLQLLAEMPYAPTPRHIIDKYGAQWTRPEHIVSSGPYLLAEHRRRALVVLTRNPRYSIPITPSPPGVPFARIEGHITESEQTAFDWYEVGKVDWTGDPALPLDKIARLLRSGRRDLHRDPYLCTYYYSIRTDKKPLDDARIRQAFDLAIDRERLLLHILQNGATVASGNIPRLFEATHGYKSRNVANFDPVRARKLLADAGYPRGLGLPELELTFNTQDIHRVVAEFVQRSLARHLGVTVTLANMEWKTLLKRMQSGDYQLSRSGWCADYPDPLTYLEQLQTGATANYPAFSDPVYDELIAKIRTAKIHTAKNRPAKNGTAADRDLRNHLIAQAEERLAEQRPILPLFHYARAYLLRPHIQGFEPQMQDFHPFKYLASEQVPGKGRAGKAVVGGQP